MKSKRFFATLKFSRTLTKKCDCGVETRNLLVQIFYDAYGVGWKECAREYDYKGLLK